MDGQYNLRNPAVKRLMKEAREMKDATELFHAQPLEDNLFEWHFTIRGPSDTEFDGGIYHGRIILPPEYPMKPPSIILLTPNGRFEVNKKICLSISGFHPESWQPSWSIRTALLAIIGFMPTHGNGAIGSLDYTADERRQLAKKSNDWSCASCGNVRQILPPVTSASSADIKEAKELANQINFQGEKEKSVSTSSEASASPTSNGDQNSPVFNPPVMPPFPFPSPSWYMFPQTRHQQPNQSIPLPQPPQWPPQTAFPFPMNWPVAFPPQPFTSLGQQPSAVPATTCAVSLQSSSLSSPGVVSANILSSSAGSTNNTSVPSSQSLSSTESMAQTTTTSTTTTTTTTSSNQTITSTSEGLRQRNVPNVTETRHSAEVVHRTPHHSDSVLAILMVLVGLLLVILVLRRLGIFSFLGAHTDL